MIYFLLGGNIENRNAYIKDLIKGNESFFFSSNDLNKELILSYSNNVNLFEQSPVIIVDNVLNEESLDFSAKELESMKESETIFIFKEEKMSIPDQKKYKKYGEFKILESKKIIPIQKFNVFSLTDAFANRDKINAWILYNQGVEKGIEPEVISGVLFWKIKTMILNGSRLFSKDELKNQSSPIVSIYHNAHREECDFSLSLEQFILSSLSSK
jgi:hypothetical protein